ncbi:MAG TPA: hypothetical protein VGG70_13475 [Candidatus Cybelea sp.]
MSGLDSGMGGGGMEPPVSQPGSMNNGIGGVGGMGSQNGQLAGPNVGANGQEQLANPGATLAPNEAQYAIAQGPSGMKCPAVQVYSQAFACNVAFNIPTPDPNSKATASPTASPTPSPTPSSSDDDNSDDSDSASPTPTPAGMLTLQMEPLPKDVPSMNNPNPSFMHITPLVAIRLQSNMDFALNGGSTVQYTLPAMQYTGRVFALQLFYETTLRGKRVDQFILGSNYQKYTTPSANVIQFAFNVPKVMVRHTQVWLLALYSAQVPPGTTPTPSPTPSPTASPTSSP